MAVINSYKAWIEENESKVVQYVKQNDVELYRIGLFARSYNILRLNNYLNMSDIVLMSYEDIKNIEGMNSQTAKEIYAECRQYLLEHKNGIISFVDNHSEGNSEPLNELQNLLNSNDTETKEVKAQTDAIPIAQIEVLQLSTRSYNSLKRAGIDTIQDLLKRFPEIETNPKSLYSIRNLGKNSVGEIFEAITRYLCNHSSKDSTELNEDSHGEKSIEDELNKDSHDEKSIEDELNDLSATQILTNGNYRGKALEFIKQADFDLSQWSLSNRSANALKKRNINTFYELALIYPDGISSIRNLGMNSVYEISSFMKERLEKLYKQLVAYCSGNKHALYTDEYIKKQIIVLFENSGFIGLSYKEIKAVFPDDLDDALVKKCIGELIAAKELEYVDYRCYRVYPSFFDFLNSGDTGLNEKEHIFIKKRYSGETLEKIAKEYDITRERVRQITAKSYKTLCKNYRSLTGNNYFDEDYYEYLFINYETVRDVCVNYLNISEKTYNYLCLTYKSGSSYGTIKKPIEEALSDPEVDYNLKLRIRDYTNRNKLLLNGVLVNNTHTDVENYVLSHYALDEIKYEDFIALCNSVLEKNHIPYDEKYYFKQDLTKTRANSLSSSMNCLWKSGERLRYYNISEADYSELLETLNLEAFENTEVSTLKFIEDYPELMQKYDIRDQYELHNLLKKIIPSGSYHNIVFKRQPIIVFGDFDRAKAFLEILKIVSPVTAEEFAEYVHIEHGYEQSTALSMCTSLLSDYYHDGVFSVDFKTIPEERLEEFKAALSEDFYFIKEIESLYSSMYPEADTEEINPYSLKAVGFIAYTKYVIRNTYKNSEAYFKEILTKDDVFGIKPVSDRFHSITKYYDTYLKLRKSYDIIPFEQDQLINIRRLEKLHIYKKDLVEYCNEVLNYAEVNNYDYFTIYSLRESGFESELDRLGFDDIFYSGILSMCPDFTYQQVFGNTVLKIASKSDSITKKAFILSQLEKYDSVDIDEFIEDFEDEFGIRIPRRYEITEAISDTEFYYDSIMDKVYRNKNYYYEDLDD